MKGNLWMDITNKRKKGLSYTEIARKHYIDPRTAKKQHLFHCPKMHLVSSCWIRRLLFYSN